MGRFKNHAALGVGSPCSGRGPTSVDGPPRDRANKQLYSTVRLHRPPNHVGCAHLLCCNYCGMYTHMAHSMLCPGA